MSDHGLTRENLMGVLPPALRFDPSKVALAEATAEQLARRPAEIDLLRIYPAIDSLDEPLLDILAYDFKVDWWDPDYSLEEKRRTLKGSWKVHKTLGTKTAVETALRAIYPGARVEPWFEYEGGEPYHFRLHIDITEKAGDEKQQERALARVDYYKSLRDHLDGLEYTVQMGTQPLRVGGAMATVTRLPLPELPDDFSAERGKQTIHVGGMVGSVASIGLPPQD